MQENQKICDFERKENRVKEITQATRFINNFILKSVIVPLKASSMSLSTKARSASCSLGVNKRYSLSVGLAKNKQEEEEEEAVRTKLKSGTHSGYKKSS